VMMETFVMHKVKKSKLKKLEGKMLSRNAC
jgi:hypothetical protein